MLILESDALRYLVSRRGISTSSQCFSLSAGFGSVPRKVGPWSGDRQTSSSTQLPRYPQFGAVRREGKSRFIGHNSERLLTRRLQIWTPGLADAVVNRTWSAPAGVLYTTCSLPPRANVSLAQRNVNRTLTSFDGDFAQPDRCNPDPGMSPFSKHSRKWSKPMVATMAPGGFSIR